jgi:hypothetical protein
METGHGFFNTLWGLEGGLGAKEFCCTFCQDWRIGTGTEPVRYVTKIKKRMNARFPFNFFSDVPVHEVRMLRVIIWPSAVDSGCLSRILEVPAGKINLPSHA